MSTTSSVPVLDSKTAKKRKAMTQAAIPATTSGTPEAVAHEEPSNEAAEDYYMKELTKNIRNLHKKLAAVAKTEAVIIQFPDLSLDQLVAQKKINNDQKAQIQKKPQLEAQVAQLEEQQKQLIEYAKAVQAKHEKEKADLTQDHEAALLHAREEATNTASTASAGKVSDALNIVVQFLHAAAYKRQSEQVEPTEAKAYEGVLFHLYQGNATSHDAIMKLVDGSTEKIVDPHSNEELDFTYAQLRVATVSGADADVDGEAGITHTLDEKNSPPSHPEAASESDPTIANAGLTEIEHSTKTPVPGVETHSPETDSLTVAPEQASADVGNAVAEAAWTGEASITTDATQNGEDWVQVPRDPAETETGSAALPATQGSTSNWADEAVAAAADRTTSTPSGDGDGFNEVRREHRGRGRGASKASRGHEGKARGRGRGGDYRGRGRVGRSGPRGGTSGPAAPPAST